MLESNFGPDAFVQIINGELGEEFKKTDFQCVLDFACDDVGDNRRLACRRGVGVIVEEQAGKKTNEFVATVESVFPSN